MESGNCQHFSEFDLGTGFPQQCLPKEFSRLPTAPLIRPPPVASEPIRSDAQNRSPGPPGWFRGRRLNPTVDALVVTALLVYAFFFNLVAGSRGFYALDQSIAFDGAYRILQGQIPYLDFLIPCGPVTFWLQALFFKVFGINYGAFLVGASTINALAALCAIRLTRLYTSNNKLLSMLPV